MSIDRQFEEHEIDEAATEAAQIGGDVGEQGVDEAQRAVIEGGGGVSEGFEQAEQALIEHASHGDQQSAHVILHHQGQPEESNPTRTDSEADHEHSSELEEDEPRAAP